MIIIENLKTAFFCNHFKNVHRVFYSKIRQLFANRRFALDWVVAFWVLIIYLWCLF